MFWGFYSNYSKNVVGGGVSLHVEEDIDFKFSNYLTSNDIEASCGSVTTAKIAL